MAKAYQANELQGSINSDRRRIIVVVVPPVDELDLVGPLKVLGAANRLAAKPVYEVQVVTNKKELVVQGEEGLLSFSAHGHFQDVKGRFDSVLLVCGLATRTERDPVLSAWMKKTAPGVRRFGSVCVGSFLLAEAGLLNGKRATTHWKFGQELANRYPQVRVESEPIWVKDGNIYTSAGISAGIDLALAWVEEDCGVSIAQEIARELVLFLRRSGKHKQVSVSLSAQASEMKAIQELQVWILENVRKKLSVQMLADRVAMSVRNFERVFVREVGETPSRYLLRIRVEAARLQLERTDRGLKHIAFICGFANAGMMRRAFLRTMGTTPHKYRQKLAEQ
ncbi:DJ-1/PfpI family protein [bacterium]|nr:DJ-1/PfpI family protein [bacterium]MCI0601455.1 DJ-1/PfpI family protein [bacterium]